MIKNNVMDTFALMFEAGYLFKYKDIVWQPVEDESEEDKSESGSDDGLQFHSARKRDRKSVV